MRARDAQVEEESIDARHLRRAQELIQIPKVTLQELVRRIGGLSVKSLPRCRERHVILIDTEQQPFRAHALGHPDGVAGAAECAIAHDRAELELKRLEHFLEHDGFMPIFRCQRTCCLVRVHVGRLL